MGSTIASLEAYGRFLKHISAATLQTEKVSNPQHLNGSITGHCKTNCGGSIIFGLKTESSVIDSYTEAFIDVDKYKHHDKRSMTAQTTKHNPGLAGNDFDYWSIDAKDRLHITTISKTISAMETLFRRRHRAIQRKSLGRCSQQCQNSLDYSSENYQSFFSPGLDGTGKRF